MAIADNLRKIRSLLPDGVRLAAVSKFHSESAIMEAYEAGHRLFAENRVQELVSKYQHLPKDIEWHMIGHLQTNKVRLLAPFVSVIESVDSLRLLSEIDREGGRHGRCIDVLLQIHIAKEKHKFGFSFDEAEAFFADGLFASFDHVRVAGLMGVASLTEERDLIRTEFVSIGRFFRRIREKYFADGGTFRELSIGMSGDYEMALEAGSTIIRLGSAIFGDRRR
ncbi:MAG: YggS family pyridoxal phosphate-dependent enzyme [Dysgonamonadaceae bacterium]|jgi:pyridoxal phosphate enzyme (YggS family)|nr:YggS family pyridoxal phosphate-dependent enzyme [Dysgonamonadaceae bacterium]